MKEQIDAVSGSGPDWVVAQASTASEEFKLNPFCAALHFHSNLAMVGAVKCVIIASQLTLGGHKHKHHLFEKNAREN